MVPIGAKHWESLEARSPTLFLVAGALLVVYAAVFGTITFADPVVEQNVFKIGYVFGFLGLLGLYPTVVGRNPRLARVGAVAAALGLVAISAFTTNDLAVLAGLVSGGDPGWYVFFIPLALIGFLVGYLAFGVASLRSDVFPPVIGLVLLVPGLIVIVMLALILAGYADDQSAFVISAGEALAHLAIGATLRTKSSVADRDESSTDGDRELMAYD